MSIESPVPITSIIAETAVVLEYMSGLPERSPELEKRIAWITNEYSHRFDESSFMITLEVLASRMFGTRFDRVSGKDTEISTVPDTKVRATFYGFYRGDELKFNELGTSWYLYFDQGARQFYVPVESLERVSGSDW